MTFSTNLSLRVLRWLLLSALAAGALGLLATGGLYLYLAPGLPAVERLEEVQLQEPLRVYAANGELMATFGAKRRLPVELAAVPQTFRNAFIAAEDNRFHEHPGVDWMGIVRAAWNLVLTGDKSQGGSTITMQVARNFFLTPEKTYIRKIREIFLALRIGHALSKDEILELYLNKIYLGQGAYGIAAAARTYYGKAVDELDLAQMATIAGLPKAPSYFNPAEHPERARWRRDYVLRRMHENGMIDRARLQAALSQPIDASVHGPPVAVDAPFVAEMARRRAVQRLGEAAYTGGYSVYTTVVPQEQRSAVEAVREGLLEYTRRHGFKGPVARVDAVRLPSPAQVRQLLEARPVAARQESSGDRVARGSASGGLQPPILEPGTLNLSGLDAVLAKHETLGGLRPGVVLSVGQERATVYRRRGGLAGLPWQSMQWAAPRAPDGGTGPSPESPRDVLAAGDIVYVAGDPEADEVALAQPPDVDGALVALDPHDGAIRALVGGFDFGRSRFNRATQADRQAGSSFKPFVYSAALSRGFTAATRINDAPVVFDEPALEDTWRPQNYSGRVFGPTRLREGLVHSRNLVSIRVLRAIGIPYTIDYLRRFGFRASQLPHNLTLALGSASVTPLQLARGYAVFANMGYRVEPYFVTRIAGPDGEILHRADPAFVCDPACRRAHAGRAGEPGGSNGAAPRYAPRVITRQNAYLVRSFLRDVARRGTAAGTRALGRDDIAAKTGTTDDQHDAWLAGFNGSLVATTWVGHDRLRSLGPGETGAGAALPIWVDFMDEALEGVATTWPALPPGMVTVRIDPETGRRASAQNEDAIFEIFREQNVPTARGGKRDAPATLF